MWCCSVASWGKGAQPKAAWGWGRSRAIAIAPQYMERNPEGTGILLLYRCKLGVLTGIKKLYTGSERKHG